MYIGEPQRVAAITPSLRKRANPKSASLITGMIIFAFEGWINYQFQMVAAEFSLEDNKAKYFGVSGHDGLFLCC